MDIFTQQLDVISHHYVLINSRENLYSALCRGKDQIRLGCSITEARWNLSFSNHMLKIILSPLKQQTMSLMSVFADALTDLRLICSLTTYISLYIASLNFKKEVMIVLVIVSQLTMRK